MYGIYPMYGMKTNVRIMITTSIGIILLIIIMVKGITDLNDNFNLSDFIVEERKKIPYSE